MKTNGSMIHRQWHINNAIRERPAPLASSLITPFLLCSPTVHPSHPFLLCSLFSLLAETDYFACRACYSWLAGCSLVPGKEPYKVLVHLKQDPLSVQCKKENDSLLDSLIEEELQVCPLLAALTPAFAVNLSPATAFVLTSCLPFSLCFNSQFSLPFVMWKGPAGKVGLSVEQWSILIH